MLMGLFSGIYPYHNGKMGFIMGLSWKMDPPFEGPVWYTIYHHLPVVISGFLQPPKYSSTNQWEFGTSMATSFIPSGNLT